MSERQERPWGNYQVYLEECGAKTKRLEVHPGRRLSLQKHLMREEKWIVLSGQGQVTVDRKCWNIGRGDFIEVPRKAVHRIHNTGKAPLVFVEVQLGDYLGEDDIVRLEDDYGRAPAVSEGSIASR